MSVYILITVLYLSTILSNVTWVLLHVTSEPTALCKNLTWKDYKTYEKSAEWE